jgi:hypothetical protein
VSIVAGSAATPTPTRLAALPPLLAYTQSLGLERFFDRPKRGVPLVRLVLLWLVLAWLGSGRPFHLDHLVEPLLAALLGGTRLPCAKTLRRSLTRLATTDVRAAVEAAYQAELPHRTGRVWAALDAHQVPYWGRGKTTRFQKGWSGSHGRSLRGYRLFLAVDTDTGQIITYLLAHGRTRDAQLVALLTRRVRWVLGRRLAGVVADCGFTSRAALTALMATKVPFILGFARTKPVKARLARLTGHERRWLRAVGAVDLGACPWNPGLRLIALAARTPTDQRGPWVYVTCLGSMAPKTLARLYRQRWRVEQVIDELLHGHDLDHLVGYRLHPNRVAIGLRLLARNLAIGYQFHTAGQRPATIREPRAFRVAAVEGLATYIMADGVIVLTPINQPMRQELYLPWSHQTLRYAA